MQCEPGAVLALRLHELLITSADSTHVVDLFRSRFDGDSDGLVSPEEWHCGLLALGLDCTREEADETFALTDPDRSGTLDFDELQRFLMKTVYDRVSSSLHGGTQIADPLEKLAEAALFLAVPASNTTLESSPEAAKSPPGRNTQAPKQIAAAFAPGSPRTNKPPLVWKSVGLAARLAIASRRGNPTPRRIHATVGREVAYQEAIEAGKGLKLGVGAPAVGTGNSGGAEILLHMLGSRVGPSSPPMSPPKTPSTPTCGRTPSSPTRGRTPSSLTRTSDRHARGQSSSSGVAARNVALRANEPLGRGALLRAGLIRENQPRECVGKNWSERLAHYGGLTKHGVLVLCWSMDEAALWAQSTERKQEVAQVARGKMYLLLEGHVCWYNPEDKCATVKNGFGHVLMPDGEIYTGLLRDGAFHGHGHSKLLDGTSYEGGFEYGLKHGRGTTRFTDGLVFVGEYKEDKRHGPGRVFAPKKFPCAPDGSVYDVQPAATNLINPTTDPQLFSLVCDGWWEEGVFRGS